MTELKPCPFCGGEARMIYDLMSDGYGYNKIACKECGANTPGNYSKEGDQATWDWNSRHERTCRNKSVEGKRLLLCSKCGAFTSVTNATENIAVRYCGNCGAKVVDE